MTKSSTRFKWTDLLLNIEKHRVIPVVGRELLVVSIDGEEKLLDRHLAESLADQLEIRKQLPRSFSLDDVANRYLELEGRENRGNIYSRLGLILEEEPPPIPKPLETLAKITDFQVLVSTTFDSLLAQAIEKVGRGKPEVLFFSNHDKPGELPRELGSASYVYQIFGKLTGEVDCAVTEEDHLEFLHSLQSEKQPRALFERLKQSHLLFIGTGFPDWQARFFIRTLRGNRLLGIRHLEAREVIADSEAQPDKPLACFLENWSTPTEIYVSDGGRDNAGPRSSERQKHPAVEFVDALYDGWRKRPRKLSAAEPTEQPPEMEKHAVFLSYTSVDRQAVERISEELKAKQVAVWFDQRSLKAGDAWKRIIENNIYHCSVFLPVISRSAQQKTDGFFRREWKMALKKADDYFGSDFPFIQPIIIDDTPNRATGIPVEFWEWQVSRFRAGRPSKEFVENLRQTVCGLEERRKGVAD